MSVWSALIRRRRSARESIRSNCRFTDRRLEVRNFTTRCLDEVQSKGASLRSDSLYVLIMLWLTVVQSSGQTRRGTRSRDARRFLRAAIIVTLAGLASVFVGFLGIHLSQVSILPCAPAALGNPCFGSGPGWCL